MVDETRRRVLIATGALVVAPPRWVPAAVAAGQPQSLQLTARDGAPVFGRFMATPDPGAPLILLFHQAGSSKDEYGPVQPRLAAEGYASLAIDQRSGGSLLGGCNETVAAHGGADAGYDDAYPDLEAALAWARATEPRRPIVLCGSSYSAALVFLLAAAHPSEVAAVLAFSPGEYLARAGTVGAAAATLRMPVFVTSAPTASEEAAAAQILAVVPAALKIQLRQAKGGVHGASSLRDDSNPQGASYVWQGTLAFLREAVPTSR